MVSRWRTFLLLIVVLVAVSGATPDDLPTIKTQAAPELNAPFQQCEGWIGADGAYSTALSTGKTLWLFSDTWVGKFRDGRRVDATIVNNTVAIQDGKGPDAKVRFFVRHDEHSKPVAFAVPADGRGWFWLQAGTRIGEKLYLFSAQIERTNDPGVFGFRQIGQWLGVVENPNADPLQWKMQQRKLPCTIFNAERQISFGAGLLPDGNELYIYGTDENLR